MADTPAEPQPTDADGAVLAPPSAPEDGPGGDPTQGDPGDETDAQDGAEDFAEPDVDDETPEELEHEIGRIVDAAQKAGNWQPEQAERCKALAQRVVELRGDDAEISPLISRWL